MVQAGDNARRAMVETALAIIEEAKRTQPERLAEARADADDERIKALTAEPWPDAVIAIPTTDIGSGECDGMLSMPSVGGTELFGTRLAFDLLGCCGDEEQVAAKLREFRRMIRDPVQMVLVFAAALDTIAAEVVPALLDRYEEASGDYDARVRFANAARTAWSARVADFDDGEEAEE